MTSFNPVTRLMRENFPLWVEAYLIPYMRMAWGFPIEGEWTRDKRMPLFKRLRQGEKL